MPEVLLLVVCGKGLDISLKSCRTASCTMIHLRHRCLVNFQTYHIPAGEFPLIFLGQ
jgi:hypothetical protein